MNRSDYSTLIHWPIVRRRTCIETADGNVSAFYVQLEMNLSPSKDSESEWTDIACFDHQPERERGHDVTREGLHLDIYHPNGPDRMITDFCGVDLNHAPRFCELYFEGNYRELCRQYADWAGKTKVVRILTPL